MDPPRDYYEVLGVSRSAPPRDIKAQYLKAAQKYHPDKNPKADAAEKFKLASDAYETLMCPSKRAMYDTRVAGNRSFQSKSPYSNTDVHGRRQDRGLRQMWLKTVPRRRQLLMYGLPVALLTAAAIYSFSAPSKPTQRRGVQRHYGTGAAQGRGGTAPKSETHVMAIWDRQQNRWVEAGPVTTNARGRHHGVGHRDVSSMRVLPKHVLDYSGDWNQASEQEASDGKHALRKSEPIAAATTSRTPPQTVANGSTRNPEKVRSSGEAAAVTGSVVANTSGATPPAQDSKPAAQSSKRLQGKAPQPAGGAVVERDPPGPAPTTTRRLLT
eukprot:INCI12937.1.p1 GENE.INCI12937.1~~INCI12937.1.p1  ORF type:complete len:326 (-),score=40.31 INCI12937.1:231-1208(-)